MQGKNERLRMRRERGTFLKRCLALRTENADIKKIFPGDNCKEWGAFWERAFHGSIASFGARRFPKGAPSGAYPLSQRGMTRRLRRGTGTWRPMGRSHFSFGGERKVCKRKPAARHYGKKALIAHFDGGARNVARNGAGQTQMTMIGMFGGGLDGFAARKDRLNFLLRLAASILKQRWLGYFDTAWIVL